MTVVTPRLYPSDQLLCPFSFCGRKAGGEPASFGSCGFVLFHFVFRAFSMEICYTKK